MPLSLAENQAVFSEALLDAGLKTPENLIRPDGHRADRRFAVYRNNVAVSLIDALQTAFPVTLKLVGEDFFRAMAGEYARVVIPKNPVLNEYGDSFPDFISSFEPARELPYLPDVAALEFAWTQSYHAADALSLSSIEGLDGNELVGATCLFHPSVRLVSSNSPVGTIWLGHESEPFSPPATWVPEFVMLARPDVEVVLYLLDAAEFIFTEQLHRGEKIESAAIAAFESRGSFDPGACLVKLLGAGAIISIQLHNHLEGSQP